jgi:hypothetical protein
MIALVIIQTVIVIICILVGYGLGTNRNQD